MKLLQTLKLAWTNIIGNRMRSFLTMLGMIIGVTSVIVLVSLMQGYFNSFLSSFSDMGINDISVSLMGRNGNLMVDEDDMYQYAKDHGDTITGVTPNVPVQAVLNNKSIKEENPIITGIDENFVTVKKKKLQAGHNITYSDVATRQRVCIIGSYINLKLFKNNAQIGDEVRVNGVEFTIVGILEQISDSTQWSSDNCFYIPYTAAMRLSGTGKISSYNFSVSKGNQVIPVTKALQKYFFNIYHDTEAFKVTNNIDFLKQIQTEMAILTSVIAGIAGISLVVAGVGIMNIMLVSVSERTREIGIRKSLGAKHRDIMSQFVIEAATTSTLGGLMGIGLGALLTDKIGQMLKFKAYPNFNTVLMAFGISVGIGILFGYLPAKKAAKLNPIDALRSE